MRSNRGGRHAAATAIKNYWGGRGPDGTVRVHVEQEGQRYPVRQLADAPLTGFEYGDDSPGADTLARALLADYLGRLPDPSLCRAFRRRFIESRNRRHPWTISGTEIAAWLAVVQQLRPDDVGGRELGHGDMLESLPC